MEFPGKLLYFSEKIKTKKIKKKQILNVEIPKTKFECHPKTAVYGRLFFFCIKTMNTLLLFEYNSIVFFFFHVEIKKKKPLYDGHYRAF